MQAIKPAMQRVKFTMQKGKFSMQRVMIQAEWKLLGLTPGLQIRSNGSTSGNPQLFNMIQTKQGNRAPGNWNL